MIATATLILFQKDHGLYDVAALATVLGKPRILGGQWFFDHQICDEPVQVDDDEESIALGRFQETELKDIEELFGQEFADFVACEAEIDCQLEEWEAEERQAYHRDLRRGRVLV